MEPATGAAVTVGAALAALDALRIDDAATRFADDALVAGAPDPGPRAGLVALSVTVAAPVLDAFVAGATPVASIGLGATASPGRIVGPSSGGPSADRLRQRALPRRGPDPAGGLVGPRPPLERSWRRSVRGSRAACTGCARAPPAPGPHAGARADRHRAGASPELACHHAAQLAPPRQRRHRGPRPDGPGTIPAARPMQTPDFWSIPFVSGPPVAADAPPLLGAVLARSPARRRRRRCVTTTASATGGRARHAGCARPRRAVERRGRGRAASMQLERRLVNPNRAVAGAVRAQPPRGRARRST